eukprot:TRINITY_DN24933_c0_g1_i2.p1 TRINITY_DN24933_c0_g1~~TRINITY_DN24933_c0_g1_i2.p1  ORF type:complete len:124 (-),score=20.76 TRINITY_DN24933_c0_g1_i2:312-683(-)
MRPQTALRTMAVALCLGTLLMMSVDGMQFTDALYYMVMALSGVGFGDVVPSTGLARWLSAAVVVLGMGGWLTLAQLLGDRDGRGKKRYLVASAAAGGALGVSCSNEGLSLGDSAWLAWNLAIS